MNYKIKHDTVLKYMTWKCKANLILFNLWEWLILAGSELTFSLVIKSVNLDRINLVNQLKVNLVQQLFNQHVVLHYTMHLQDFLVFCKLSIYFLFINPKCERKFEKHKCHSEESDGLGRQYWREHMHGV